MSIERGYSKTPHQFWDLMQVLSDPAWRIAGLVWRETAGWHRDTCKLSYEKIRQRCNIRSDATICKGIKELAAKGYMAVDSRPHANVTSRYTLLWKPGSSLKTVELPLQKLKSYKGKKDKSAATEETPETCTAAPEPATTEGATTATVKHMTVTEHVVGRSERPPGGWPYFIGQENLKPRGKRKTK